nr:hypothetical protein CFP56_52582 [Quercus suber]
MCHQRTYDHISLSSAIPLRSVEYLSLRAAASHPTVTSIEVDTRGTERRAAWRRSLGTNAMNMACALDHVGYVPQHQMALRPASWTITFDRKYAVLLSHPPLSLCPADGREPADPSRASSLAGDPNCQSVERIGCHTLELGSFVLVGRQQSGAAIGRMKCVIVNLSAEGMTEPIPCSRHIQSSILIPIFPDGVHSLRHGVHTCMSAHGKKCVHLTSSSSCLRHCNHMLSRCSHGPPFASDSPTVLDEHFTCVYVSGAGLADIVAYGIILEGDSLEL